MPRVSGMVARLHGAGSGTMNAINVNAMKNVRQV